MNLKSVLIPAGLAGALLLASCGEEAPAAINKDKTTAGDNLNRLSDSQPIPEFDWSQIRQNLIELNKAQAETTQTTTFFFNLGVPDPIASCPSIGFPIPSTTQLTNPLQTIGNSNTGLTSIAQAEQTGVYTGDSTGTYAFCVNAEGEPYAFYWEGFVSAITGPAEWDKESSQVKLIGSPSFKFSSEKD